MSSNTTTLALAVGAAYLLLHQRPAVGPLAPTAPTMPQQPTITPSIPTQQQSDVAAGLQFGTALAGFGAAIAGAVGSFGHSSAPTSGTSYGDYGAGVSSPNTGYDDTWDF